MHMTFWFGYEMTDLLFQKLNVSTVIGFIVTCVCTLGIAVFYESLKGCLAFFKYNSAVSKVPNRHRCLSDGVLIENRSPVKSGNAWTVIEVGVYAVEVTVGYIIMLLVMTYNVYLLVVLLVGSGICYSLYGHQLLSLKMKTSKLKIPCEHCMKHQREDSYTSSTVAITENMSDINEGNCCAHSPSNVTIHNNL